MQLTSSPTPGPSPDVVAFLAPNVPAVPAGSAQPNVSTVNVGCLSSLPSNVQMHVDWDRRITAITYSYSHGQAVSAPVSQSAPNTRTNSTGTDTVFDDGLSSEHTSQSPHRGTRALRAEGKALPFIQLPRSPALGNPHRNEDRPVVPLTNPSGEDIAAPAMRPEGRPNQVCIFPERRKHKIYGTDPEKYTVWYTSRSQKPLKSPPQGLMPKNAFLYVHSHDGGVQLWVYLKCIPRQGSDLEDTTIAPHWERIQTGYEHPGRKMDSYVVHLLDNGEPRWVKLETALGYAARKNARVRARKAYHLSD